MLKGSLWPNLFMTSSHIAKAVDDRFYRFYGPKEIASETGLAESTVRHRIAKLRAQAKQWLGELAREGYLGEYKRTLDVYDQIIKETMEKKTELEESRSRLHQEIDNALTEKNAFALLPQKVSIDNNYYSQWFNCQRIIHFAVKHKLETLNDGPMVWAMEQFIRQNTPKEVTGAAMKVLTGEKDEEGLAERN